MKLLSRKVLSSLAVFITATLMLWFGRIEGFNWVILSVGTLVGYLAGDGLGYLVYFIRDNKRIENEREDLEERGVDSFSELKFKDKLKIRLKNLFAPSFIAAICIYAVGTFMLWCGKINTTEWIYVALGMVIGYDLLNPLEKLN